MIPRDSIKRKAITKMVMALQTITITDTHLGEDSKEAIGQYIGKQIDKYKKELAHLNKKNGIITISSKN